MVQPQMLHVPRMGQVLSVQCLRARSVTLSYSVWSFPVWTQLSMVRVSGGLVYRNKDKVANLEVLVLYAFVEVLRDSLDRKSVV